MDELSEKFQTVLVSYLTYALFFNGWWFKDVKHGLSVFSVHKYIYTVHINTNIQLHRNTDTQLLCHWSNRLLHSRPGLFVLLLKIPFVQKHLIFIEYCPCYSFLLFTFSQWKIKSLTGVNFLAVYGAITELRLEARKSSMQISRPANMLICTCSRLSTLSCSKHKF